MNFEDQAAMPAPATPPSPSRATTPDIPAARICVIGVGGGGGNAVATMQRAEIRGVELHAVNTDAQALDGLAVDTVMIGQDVTRGLGAGADPELGRLAAEESRGRLLDMVSGCDMVFVACGAGGGTGTGAAPVICALAKEAGALTVAVATSPFSFEGRQRMRIAEAGLAELDAAADALIHVPNQALLGAAGKQTTLQMAFQMADDVLRQGVQGIADLITTPGIINLDFADVKTVMQGAGRAVMGIGEAEGTGRAERAAQAAITSPLLETSVQGASALLVQVRAGSDLGLFEVQEAVEAINAQVGGDCQVILGTVVDDSQGDLLSVTVVATGIDSTKAPSADWADELVVPEWLR